MDVRNRQSLKQDFEDGERPSGTDFSDLIDSFVNKLDDGVVIDEQTSTFVLSNGLQLGDSDSDQPGTLRFNGVVQVFDGADWADVGGGGESFFVDAGAGSINFSGGNVGIGDFSTSALDYRLDVNIGRDTGLDQRVRFGNFVISNGNRNSTASHAMFYHQDVEDFAFRQTPDGDVTINTPGQSTLRFTQTQAGAQTTRLLVTETGEVVIGSGQSVWRPGFPDHTPDVAAPLLQVAGTVLKTGGSTANGSWDYLSDARVKDDIQDLDMGLSEIKNIRPVRYKYNGLAGTTKDAKGIGVIGQEIENIVPETVTVFKNTTEIPDLRVYNESALTYVLINSVKELSATIEQMQSEIAALKKVANDAR